MIEIPAGIVIAGSFSSVNGVARNSLARLSQTGAVDLGFDVPVSDSSPNKRITSLLSGANDDFYITGFFDQVGGQSHQGLARVLNSGQVDANFAIGSGAGAGTPSSISRSAVSVLARLPAGDLLAGGGMRFYDGTARQSLARLTAGGLNPTLDAGVGRALLAGLNVQKFLVEANGSVLMAGNFTHVGGSMHLSLARLVPTTAAALVARADGQLGIVGSAGQQYDLEISDANFGWQFQKTVQTTGQLDLIPASGEGTRFYRAQPH